ncbi:MAG: hypothetical protein KAH20_15205 [Methylococcales bacterium]|nr:hypothetical protein [Methylococcales bacterium]
MNYFNLIKRKRFLFVVFCISSLIVGCADFYSYGSPTSVYKSSKNDPYKKKSINTNKNRYKTSASSDVVLEKVFEPELTPIQSGRLKTEEEWALENSNKSQRGQITDGKRALSPAILALVTDADESSRSGDLESAGITIERALRIDSRNPLLTYKLAKIRLQQSKPKMAENLARKSALLSANDKVLKRNAWLLISEARKQQNNYHGAKEAILKASNI